MILVNIYSMNDAEGQIIASLGTGVHLLGRGNLLKVADKRISRKHAIIEVSEHKITLTSIHINPCFFKAANSKVLTILSQNQPNEIRDGDQFALLPESCWYQAKIKCEAPDQPASGPEKRIHEQEMNESCDAKKARLSTMSTSDCESNETVPVSLEQVLNDTKESCALSPTVVPKTEEPDQMDIAEAPAEDKTDTNNEPTVGIASEIPEVTLEVKQELIEIHEEILEQPSPAVEIKAEPADDQSKVAEAPQDSANAADQPSTSASAPKPPERDRCWYGDTCYRKNPSHKAAFSHPGDADYDLGVDGGQPECPFGAACYRSNVEHRKMYKHSSRPAKKPSAQAPKKWDDGSENDYDYSDPFFNDDSSDDFEISDFGIDSSESDFDEAPEVDEKHRLLREAKKFINRK